jgi:hypothetical protein
MLRFHWQLADGDRVTTYKTYYGTHRAEFLGVAPTGRKIQFETVDVMRMRGGIGIVGSGAIGTAFARTLARAGIEATISNSRGPDSLQDLVHEVGPSIKATTREEATRADIIFIAVNWTKLPAALAGLPDWGGRIVIDANNPIEAPLFKPVDLHGRVSSELVAWRAGRESVQSSSGGDPGR